MTIRLWRAVLQLPGQRVAASRDVARGAHVPAHPQVQPRHAEAVRACARREHATPPRATPARTLWLTLYAPFGRLQESPDGFYGTICSAETLLLDQPHMLGAAEGRHLDLGPLGERRTAYDVLPPAVARAQEP